MGINRTSSNVFFCLSLVTVALFVWSCKGQGSKGPEESPSPASSSPGEFPAPSSGGIAGSDSGGSGGGEDNGTAEPTPLVGGTGDTGGSSFSGDTGAGGRGGEGGALTRDAVIHDSEITVDLTPPETTFTKEPPTGFIKTSSVTVEFTSSDPGSTFLCKLDAAEASSCVSPLSFTALPEGAHHIEVTAISGRGVSDLTPAISDFTVDFTAPHITIETKPLNLDNHSRATFTFSASEAGVLFKCKLDGGPEISCNTPYEVTVADGVHTFVVSGVDLAGNPAVEAPGIIRPERYDWTVDTTPPTVVETKPQDAELRVAPNTIVLVTFSEVVDITTVTNSSLGLYEMADSGLGPQVAADISCCSPVALSSEWRASLNPRQLLQEKTYWVALFPAIRDLAGNPLIEKRTGFTVKIRVVAISAGANHNLALKEDGSLWTWGDNQFGQLGVGKSPAALPYSRTPVLISRPSGLPPEVKFISIAAGGYHTLARASDGSLWAWGRNQEGQLGNGTNSGNAIAGGAAIHTSPIRVSLPVSSTSTPTQIVKIAAGLYHSLALAADNTVWAWGDNTYGQLGDKTNVMRNKPVQVLYQSPSTTTTTSGWLSGISSISIPIPLPGIVDIAAGSYHNIARQGAINSTLWAWGANGEGQLGDGTTSNRFGAVQVISEGAVGYFKQAVSIAAGGAHSLAMKPASDGTGTVWAWGRSLEGQLGNGSGVVSRSYSAQPVQVKVPSLGVIEPQQLLGAVAIAAGQKHSMAIINGDFFIGAMVAWGSNEFGQLGTGTSTGLSAAGGPPNSVILATLVIDLDDSTRFFINTKAIADGANHTLVLKSDGTVFAWGDNSVGQIGEGLEIRYSSTPSRIFSLW